jgi:hypothetical protein
MNFKIIKIIVLTLFIINNTSNCSNDSSNNNALAALATSSPIITELNPTRVHPTIVYGNVSYPSKEMKILGRNFSLLPTDLQVKFGIVPSTILSSTESEILVKVPDEISTGILTVSKSGGVCNSADGKSGINCGGRQYYVDCYEGINKPHSEEILLTVGKIEKITYNKTEFKAFKSELNPTPKTVQIRCPEKVSIAYFNKQCKPDETLKDVTNPQWNIEGGFTHQFLMFTTSGECDIFIF